MRRLIAFDCAGGTLLGSLDEAESATGLLIVSGGNEIRTGAHRGMALLAARLAAQGISVFRYDRRGVGDSTGPNTGYRDAQDDLIAAVTTFRANAPQVTRIVGFGNCDGAATLALFGRAAGIDAVILANPWVVETTDDLPPPAAIRAHYMSKLRDPREWLRFVRGGVSIEKLFNGLWRISQSRSQDGALADRTTSAIAEWEKDAAIILAKDDATAIAYADAAHRARIAPCTITIDTSSHSFARSEDAAALEKAITGMLTRYSAAS